MRDQLIKVDAETTAPAFSFFGPKGTEGKVMADNYLHTKTIFDAETVAAGANSESDSIDLNKFRPTGYFAVELTISGSGTAKLEYQISIGGSNYGTPDDAVPIAEDHTATSGPNGDGVAVYRFRPKPHRHLKLKISETGGADTIVVTANLLVH